MPTSVVTPAGRTPFATAHASPGVSACAARGTTRSASTLTKKAISVVETLRAVVIVPPNPSFSRSRACRVDRLERALRAHRDRNLPLWHRVLAHVDAHQRPACEIRDALAPLSHRRNRGPRAPLTD